MRIAVMGTGGVGGYFGARLALGGSDVTFIARGAQLGALRQHGLRVLSAGGDMHVEKVSVTDDPRQVGPVDLVLFGVKLWDTEEAARQVMPMLGGNAAVVSFQNGVLKDEVLRRALGDRAVIGGVCYIAATIAEPGVIRHAGAIRAHPQTRALLQDSIREAVAVGQSEGVQLDADYADNRLVFCDTLPAEMTSSCCIPTVARRRDLTRSIPAAAMARCFLGLSSGC